MHKRYKKVILRNTLKECPIKNGRNARPFLQFKFNRLATSVSCSFCIAYTPQNNQIRTYPENTETSVNGTLIFINSRALTS